jgi:hypothetical protein
MKFFENKDFHYNESFKVQRIPFLDSSILFVRNVYKRPDRVSEYLHSLGAVKSHKNVGETRNGVDFVDGQHVLHVGEDPYRHELEASIAAFYGTRPVHRTNLVFNQFRLLRDPPAGRHWWPHTDNKVNILTFLNEDHRGPGTAIYRRVGPTAEDQNEHLHPWRGEEEFEPLYTLLDQFNCLVAFPGHWHHGMSIVGNKFAAKPRFTEICFL